MATPEHLLRAGRLPVWLELDLARAARRAGRAGPEPDLRRARRSTRQYHRRHAATGQPPLDDWAKVVLVPGLGLITAFNDKRSAVTANLCYRATLEAIANAEAVDRFQSRPRPTSSSSSTGRWSGARWRRRSPASGDARSCPGTSRW